VNSFIDRLRDGKAVAGGTPRGDDELERDCPCLFQLLTELTYSDGTPRKGASLTVWWDGGSWGFVLYAREEELKWYGGSDTFKGLPKALEATLNDPEKPPRETEEGKRKRLAAAKKARRGVDS
jgi:hypothetical protein